jgi:MFS family permease
MASASTLPAVSHAWVVVGCAFVVAMCGWGFGFYGPGIYMAELHRLHGWPTSLVSTAVTLFYLVSAALIVFVADAFERFGPRRVVLTAGAAMALGVALLPLAWAPWQVFPIFLVMAVGWAGMSGAAVNTLVAPWFGARRGLAVSLALNGSSTGGIVIAPLLIFVIGRLGFRAGLHVAAATMLALMVVVTLAFRRHAPAMARPDAAAAVTRQALLVDRRFVTMCVAFALGLLAQVGFLTHQVPYLLTFVDPAGAGLAVSLTTIAALTGRTATGFIVDRLDARVVSAVNFAVQAVALVVLIRADATAPVYVGCVLLGLSVGNMVTLPSIIVQAEFPPEAFGRVISLLLSINQFTFAFGPAILGALRDWRGDYGAAFALCLALQAVSTVVVLLGRRSGSP